MSHEVAILRGGRLVETIPCASFSVARSTAKERAGASDRDNGEAIGTSTAFRGFGPLRGVTAIVRRVG